MNDNSIHEFVGKYKFLCLDYVGKFPVRLGGIEYRSATNAYESFKLNVSERSSIARSLPSTAIKRGRACELPEDWKTERDKRMYAILIAKFQPIEMAKRLAATGNRSLLAMNDTGDTYWGIDRTQGGENRLGKLLEEVREYYQGLLAAHVWIYA